MLLEPSYPDGGNAEHYYHFLFDLLLPLWMTLPRSAPAAPVAIREVGTMTPRICDVFGDRIDIVPRTSADAAVTTLPLHGMNPIAVFVRRRELEGFRRFLLGKYGVSEAHDRRLVLLIERMPPDEYFRDHAVIKGSGSSRRSIVNHGELIAELERCIRAPLRLENVQLERMSFREQLETFTRAAVVIGQHGAGLANMLWMSPGQTVVELAHRSPRHFEVLARSLGHRYVRYGAGADHARIEPSALVSWMQSRGVPGSGSC